LEKIQKEVNTLLEIIRGFMTKILDEEVSETIDISGGGFSFYSEREISPGTRFNLRLETQDPPYLSIPAVGEVRRCERANSHYCVCVKFVDINELDREELIKYIFEKQRILLQSIKGNGEKNEGKDKGEE